MSKKLQDSMTESFNRASGKKVDIKRTSSSPKMDAPKTAKVKSNIGTGYQEDKNRPRAK